MAVISRVSGRKGLFYGWWIISSGTILLSLAGGVYFYGFSVFFTPLREEFKWSATALSGAFSLSRLESGIAGPIVGFITDRMGARILMVIGFILAGVGFITLARVNSIEMFYLVFIFLMSVGASLGFGTPVNAVVANWFVRRRSFAFGIITCGMGLGGIIVPALAWAIGQFGWRETATWCGILFLAIGIPLSLVMRFRPEPYGYLPDGDSPDSGEEAALNKGMKATVDPEGSGKVSERYSEVTFTPKQAVLTSTFWVMAFCFTIRQVITNGVVIHEIPALINAGFPPEVAAGALGLMSVLSVPGRIVFGWLGDHYDKRYLMAVCFLMQLVSLTIFAYTSDFLMLAIFLAVYSPAYGGLVPLMPAMWGEFYGRKHFATILGLSQAITMLGNIAGPLLAGYTFDVSGSYQFAFLFFAASNVLGVLLLPFIRRPRLKSAYQSTPA